MLLSSSMDRYPLTLCILLVHHNSNPLRVQEWHCHLSMQSSSRSISRTSASILFMMILQFDTSGTRLAGSCFCFYLKAAMTMTIQPWLFVN
jgi:hypothetical protein